MAEKGLMTTLKCVIGIVYTLIAVLLCILIIEINGNTRVVANSVNKIEPKTGTEEFIKLKIPASVAKTSVVKLEIKPVDPIREMYFNYLSNLPNYIGLDGSKESPKEIDFDYVYERAKYWTSVYNINLPFHLSLMYVESNYRNGAVSPAGCVGLCQLSKDAVDQFNTAMWHAGVDKFYTLEEVRWDIDKNIEVSCWYLDWLWEYRKSYTNNIRKYIMSYNYGRTGVINAINTNTYGYADNIIYIRDALNRL